MAALFSSIQLSQYDQMLALSSPPIKTSKEENLVGPVSTSSSGERASSTAVSELVQPIFSRAFDHIPSTKVYSLMERVYVTANEDSQEESISLMRKYALAGNTFLAVSGFCGLNMASVCGEETEKAIDYLIIVDSCPRVEKFWQEIRVIIRQSSTRMQAWETIRALLIMQAEIFWPYTDLVTLMSRFSKVEKEVKGEMSWLSSDKRFERIKRIFDADHFVFKRLDLCNRESTHLLVRAIKDCGLTLHAAYISNIREYAEVERRLPSFQESIKELGACMNNQSLLIDTIPRPGGVELSDDHLVQRVRHGMINSDIRLTLPPSPPPPPKALEEAMKKIESQLPKAN